MHSSAFASSKIEPSEGTQVQTEPNRLTFERITLNHHDGTIAGWYSPASPPTSPRADAQEVDVDVHLIFFHATGLCAAAYRTALASIDRRISVLAVDMRGHGHTRLPARLPLRSWDIYADDIAHILASRRAAAKPGARFVLAGHSMGAVALALMAAQLVNEPDTRRALAALCLFEPVAMPQALNRLAGTPLWAPVRKRFSMVVNASKRRHQWADRSEVLASYCAKPFFAKWNRNCLDDYLVDGLTDDESGVHLSCSPQWEAATFGAQANAFWPAMKKIAGLAQVVRGTKPDSTVRAFAAERLKRWAVPVIDLDAEGHMFPMHNPAATASIINTALMDAARKAHEG